MAYFKNFPIIKYKFGNNEESVFFKDASIYVDLIDQALCDLFVHLELGISSNLNGVGLSRLDIEHAAENLLQTMSNDVIYNNNGFLTARTFRWNIYKAIQAVGRYFEQGILNLTVSQIDTYRKIDRGIIKLGQLCRALQK